MNAPDRFTPDFSDCQRGMLMSNKPSSVTTSSEFGCIPVLDHRALFRVNPGIPADYALSEAACLAESIQDMAREGVQGSLGPKQSYLIAFAADVIQALCVGIEESP